MAKFNPELLEPLIEEPEVAVPVIVAWRGYETARDIKGVYDNYNPPPRTNSSHIPQPFLSGSSLPPPRYPSQSAISGRNIMRMMIYREEVMVKSIMNKLDNEQKV